MRFKNAFLALGVLLSVLSTRNAALATYPLSNPYVPAGSSGGVTLNGAKLLPFKCDADGDNTTCHLVVDVSSGGSGGSTSVVFPYNMTNGQTPTSASGVSVGGLDGNGKYSPLKLDTNQNLVTVFASPQPVIPGAGWGGVDASSNSYVQVRNGVNSQTVDTSGRAFFLLPDEGGTNTLSCATLNTVLGPFTVQDTSTFDFDISGLTSCQVTVEGKIGGGPFRALPATSITSTTGSTVNGVVTGNASYRVSAGGLSQIQFRVSTASALETASISFNGSGAPWNYASDTNGNIFATLRVSGTIIGQTSSSLLGAGTLASGNALDVAGFNQAWDGVTWNPLNFAKVVDSTRGTKSLAVAPCDSTTGKCAGVTTGNALLVDGSATTQPISGSVGVTTLPALPAGSNIIGKVGIDQTTDGTTNGVHVVNTVPVTGTFWQATQPVSVATLPPVTILAPYSGTTDTQTPVANSAIALVGLNQLNTGYDRLHSVNSGQLITTPYSATGTAIHFDVSGNTVAVGAGTAGTPSGGVVSVQGVSGGTGLPVTGTFWQTTQPVSLATLPPLAAGTAVIGHVITDTGSTTAVSSLPAIPAGTNIIGKVTTDQTTPGTTDLVHALACDATVTTQCGKVDANGFTRTAICSGSSSTCNPFGTASLTGGSAFSSASAYAYMIAANGTTNYGAPRLDAGVCSSNATCANAQLMAQGGEFSTILTSSSPTACTSIEAASSISGGIDRLVSIQNTGPAMTVFLQLYNDQTCSAANLVWGDGSTIVLPAAGTNASIANLNIPMSGGISYKLSGSLTSNLVITRN